MKAIITLKFRAVRRPVECVAGKTQLCKQPNVIHLCLCAFLNLRYVALLATVTLICAVNCYFLEHRPS